MAGWVGWRFGVSLVLFDEGAVTKGKPRPIQADRWSC